MATVSGFIRNETGGPALGATVRVFDKDLRHEQLLGEVVITETTARYEINYSADQFRRAEKKTADLIVRAFDREGNLRAESEIRFNASDNERIDLTFGPPVPIVETPRLSELEQLQQSIEPVLEGVVYHEFTDQDLVHLTEETIRAGRIGGLDRPAVRQHLGFLRLADQFGRQTGIPLAAFYGWFRQDQPQILPALLDVPTRTLRAALIAAIRGNIIPDITAQLGEILERINSVRFEQGRLVNHRFVVQLIDAVTSRPLAGYAIEVSDPAAEPESRELGILFTDGRGACVIIFSLPGDAPANAIRRLQLRIADDGTEVAGATIDVRADQKEVATVRVRLQEPGSGTAPIEDSAAPALAARLRRQGIRTLNEVLAHPELLDREDPQGLEQLRATAKFTVLAPELTASQRTHLLNRGFRRLPDVAATSRAEFIRDNHVGLGSDAAAYATHFAAKETNKVLHQLIGSTWINNVTKPDGEPPDPDIPAGVNEILSGFKKCGCKDCSSAVSPAAYLAHLLEWTLEHIKDGAASISFAQLQQEFHQPFGDLPATCSAVEEQVRQVRICVETLWRYSGLLDRTDLQLSTRLRSAYRQLRNQLYRGILTHLGTSFEQLRQATLHVQGNEAVSAQIAAQRRMVAEVLGVDEARLNALLFDIEHSAGSPSEDQLQQRFGFKSTRAEDVFAPIGTPDLVTWQREQLETIWQQLDWSTDAYSGEARLPFVDPVLIDESYLRLPLTENAAFPLLQARREVLLAHRQAMITQSTLPAGLAGLLENELGQSIEQLQNLYATLLAGEPSTEIVQVHEAIRSLHLTPAGFTYLMNLHAREVAGERIGANLQAIEAAWEAVFDILSGAARRSFFPAWVNEENDLGLIFGPKIFWLPVRLPVPVNTWQAAPADRAGWQEALARRSTRPIVDPDQISTDYIIVFGVFIAPNAQSEDLMPPLQPVTLWHQRREWIDGRLAVLQAARHTQPNPMAVLDAVLSASNAGIGLNILTELINLEAAGEDLEPHLTQLNLTSTAYRFLAEIHRLAEGDASISSTAWQEVDAILVDCEKHLEFAEWRIAEQDAGIILHPHRFVLPKNTKPADGTPQTHWLHHPIALQQWGEKLQARSDQLKALREGLAEAVSSAEEAVLPLLRNLLIMQTVAEGDSLIEKAEWLDKRLLLDMQMSGCQVTTRVSQAIETLQRFIRGVYTQEHPPLMQHLTLDAEEDYVSEWPVLGSYASWRAFMLAYLFPENLLHLSPPSRQSYGFSQLKKKLANGFTHKEACEQIQVYSGYFRDICNLDMQASCQIRTFVGASSACESSINVQAPSTLHLFARARTSGKIYWATLIPSQTADTTSSWEPLSKIGVVEKIFGATPHFTQNGQRLVVLFFSVRKQGKLELRFVTYNVDSLIWGSEDLLELPNGSDSGFSAAVIQKRGANPDVDSGDFSFPTLVAVKPDNGPISINELNPEAVNWVSSTWNILFGPWMNDNFGEVLSLVQRTSNEYLIVAIRDTRPAYRFLYLKGRGRDDLTWKNFGFSEGYNGAIPWFGDISTFLFYTDAGGTVYKRLGAAGPIRAQSRFTYHNTIKADNSLSEYQQIRYVTLQYAHDISRFNDEWLERYVGVSLRDFRIDNFRPIFFVPHIDVEGDINPLEPDSESIKQSEEPLWFRNVSLNLLEAFFYEIQGTDIGIPEDARFRYNSRAFYQIQLLYQFVQEFLKDLSGIEIAKSLQGDLGGWKFADEQISRYSNEGHNLSTLISLFVNNIAEQYMKYYVGGIYLSKSASFRERDTSDELSFSQMASYETWMFVPTSGDESVWRPSRKAVVINTPQGPCWWTRLSRQNDVLSGTKLLQIAPYGTGPFDIAPKQDIGALKKRRLEIKAMWKPLRNTPSSVRAYLKDTYHHIPLYIGYGLQRSGNYEEALLWYRQVFDYLQPLNAHRKIDYSLFLEEQLQYNFDDILEWLNDASNPHTIAESRKNTYTRHILLMIIRCLIDYANALFSRDNTTDNARARELYVQALKLLEFKELKPAASNCADILGQLEIEVVEPGQLLLQQFRAALAQIPDPDHLNEVIASLRAISQNSSRPIIDRLTDTRETVLAAVNEIPAAPRMAAVLATKRQTVAVLENQFLSVQPSRVLLTKTQQNRRQEALTNLAEVTDVREDALLETTKQLPWLRGARFEEGDDTPGEQLNLTLFNAGGSKRLAVLGQIKNKLPMASLAAIHNSSFAFSTGITFDFCIPQNPVIQALRIRAENNLTKLRTCRNIAGFLRQVDPYGAPIGIGSGLVSPDGSIFNGIVDAPPTAYRYMALINRAKELVGISQQIEASYQAALENAEREAFTLMQAEQSVELAGARVTLQDLRVTQANNELGLARLQKNSAELREETYAAWIAGGKNEHEEKMLKAYSDAAEAQKQAARARAATSVAQLTASIAGAWSLREAANFVTGVAAAQTAAYASAIASTLAEATFQERAINAEATVQAALFEADFERRNDEWQLQQGLAALDMQIGDQQIVLAQNQINVVQQEHNIAVQEQRYAIDMLNFLLGKSFTEEMYRWIASVLEDVYRFFLQEATVIARLAEIQHAFERQQARLKVIQTDYWNISGDSSDLSARSNVNRLGLTGSARLLQDIFRLDNYAFETRQRKQSLSLTLDLAAMFPVEFQRFRETGVLVFNTPQSLIDQQMPGYYLCLIQQVSISVVALIPTTYGIRATLTSAGISRTVVGGDTFQTVIIRNLPERMALTSASTSSTNVIELQPDNQSLLSPFEGSGFDTLWELRMPKAANPFDYNSMATVLFTVNLTALHSFDYEREVIQSLDRKHSFDRAFDFRQVFSDAWYDLNNPDLTNTPMVVRFNTRRSDFPPNLTNLSIQHVVLYMVRKDGEIFEQPIRYLQFTAEAMGGAVGGSAVTVSGRVSTRSGNGANWLPMIGLSPVGQWELSFPDNSEARNRFTEEEIQNILLIITFSGKSYPFPS